MPGAIPHLIAGSMMFLVGYYVFHDYFKLGEKRNKQFTLFAACIGFTVSPDVIMIFYHLTHISTHCYFEPYHILLHIIVGVLAIILFPFVYVFVTSEKRPYLLTGLSCVFVHMLMDIFIEETTIFF